jgi:hypothetical protein
MKSIKIILLTTLFATMHIVFATPDASASMTVQATVNSVSSIYCSNGQTCTTVPTINFGTLTPTQFSSGVTLYQILTLGTNSPSGLTYSITATPSPNAFALTDVAGKATTTIPYQVAYTGCDNVTTAAQTAPYTADLTANQSSVVNPGSGSWCNSLTTSATAPGTGYGTFSFIIEPNTALPQAATYNQTLTINVCTGSVPSC